MLDSLRRRARRLKAEMMAMYLACRHPRTPWYARVLAAAVVAYLVSPLDLIPDFIPVLGLVDDLILVPLGIAVVVNLIPEDVMRECRERASVESVRPTTRASRAAAVFIVVIWVVVAAMVVLWVIELLRSRLT
jgi:uncharacterized membrane protein YkvA (DUF1232 family)